MRVLGPVVNNLADSAHGLRLLARDLPVYRDAAVWSLGGWFRGSYPWGVYAHEPHAVKWEGDCHAVGVDQSTTLERVTDEGEMLGPDVVHAPEEHNGEENVVVRVQGALF